MPQVRRSPSRHIPSRRAVQHVARWAFSIILSSVAAALCWALPLFMLLPLVALLSALWVIARKSSRAQRDSLCRLAMERRGESICQFARSFDTRAVDTWVIRAVYDTLQQDLHDMHPAFPVRASDLLQDLLCDPDDLDMHLADELARRSCRSLNNPQANPLYGKIRSVGELVLFLNAQPRLPLGSPFNARTAWR